MRGDEIIAVDGVRVTEANLVSRVRGGDMIGSSCTLTLRSGREIFEARLRRAPATRVEDMAVIIRCRG